MASMAERTLSEAPTLTRQPAKSPAAFRTISEVAANLAVPQHVLRFWETRFTQVRPLKRAGGRRYYRPQDVQILARIRELLYQQGFTIRGAQKYLRERPSATPPAVASPGGIRHLAAVQAHLTASQAPTPGVSRAVAARGERVGLQGVLDELVAIRDLLHRR